MKLYIRSTPDCDQEELRTLLIDAATELAGPNNHLLEAKLPWDGCPILLADAEGYPILVSFDAENSQAALLNGLRAAEQLTAALPWVNQVYESLQQRQRTPKLVVISGEPPPAAKTILAGCPSLTLFTYRVLRINDDTGLWLECLNAGKETETTGQLDGCDTAPRTINHEIQSLAQNKAAENSVSLSEEERAYFQQL